MSGFRASMGHKTAFFDKMIPQKKTIVHGQKDHFSGVFIVVLTWFHFKMINSLGNFLPGLIYKKAPVGKTRNRGFIALVISFDVIILTRAVFREKRLFRSKKIRYESTKNPVLICANIINSFFMTLFCGICLLIFERIIRLIQKSLHYSIPVFLLKKTFFNTCFCMTSQKEYIPVKKCRLSMTNIYARKALFSFRFLV